MLADEKEQKIITEFVDRPICFTAQELLDCFEPGKNDEQILRSLKADKRFLVIFQPLDVQLFISKQQIISWFFHLTRRLIRAGQAELTSQQITNLLGTLRPFENWDLLPIEVVDFASQFALIAPGWQNGNYVFPLASLLLHSPSHIRSSILSIHAVFCRVDLTEDLLQLIANEGLDSALKNLSPRTEFIVRHRAGLLGNETLEEIGNKLGLTRERIRQIEKKFQNKIGFERMYLPMLTAFLAEAMRRKGLQLLKKTDLLPIFLANSLGIPLTRVPRTDILTLGKNKDDLGLVRYLDASILRSANIDTVGSIIDRGSKLFLSKNDTIFIAEILFNAFQARATKVVKVIMALRSIGQPAHYSDVTEVYNDLFPDDPSSEHAIHAVLSRGEQGVVWLGKRGTYALEEWGFKRPTKGLFESVQEIVEKVFAASGRPVQLTTIISEMGRYRQVINSSSLIVAVQLNPHIEAVSKDYYVPKIPDKWSNKLPGGNELDKVLEEFEARTTK